MPIVDRVNLLLQIFSAVPASSYLSSTKQTSSPNGQLHLDDRKFRTAHPSGLRPFSPSFFSADATQVHCWEISAPKLGSDSEKVACRGEFVPPKNGSHFVPKGNLAGP